MAFVWHLTEIPVQSGSSLHHLPSIFSWRQLARVVTWAWWTQGQSQRLCCALATARSSGAQNTGTSYSPHTHGVKLCSGKPSLPTLHIWLAGSERHTRFNSTCMQLQLAHTTGFATHTLPSWSISVQDIPQIGECAWIKRQLPARTAVRWDQEHFSLSMLSDLKQPISGCNSINGAPISYCSTASTEYPHQVLSQAHTLVPKAEQCIPSETGSFNITYPNNSSHFKMQNRSSEHQLLPDWPGAGQLMRSDLVSLVKYIAMNKHKRRAVPKKHPFIRLMGHSASP